MIQRCLAIFTRAFSLVFGGSVEASIWSVPILSCGHSISSHSSGCGSALFVIAMGRTYANSGKAGAQLAVCCLHAR